MNRLLLFLRRCLFGDSLPRAGVTPGPWRTVDRDNWQRFMVSETGSRLIGRLRAFEAANAIAGCQDVIHTAHSAGRAVGYGDMVSHLISLAHCKTDEPKKIVVKSEQSELEELVERFSP